MLQRREVLQALAAVLAAAQTSCFGEDTDPPQWSGPPRGVLIDAHCHIFNGSDLPMVRFIKNVVLERYPKQAVSTLDVNDPDALDGLIALLTWLVGRSRAPSATRETRVLDGQEQRDRVAYDAAANDQSATEAIAAFLENGAIGVLEGDEVSEQARERIREGLIAAAGAGAIATDDAPMSADEIAERAYRSESDIGHYLRWAALFTRYRSALADRLTQIHSGQGFTPLFFAPALIDYDKWLDENVDQSPLPEQVALMGRISRRRTGPPIHGYVAFDPLREAYFRRSSEPDANQNILKPGMNPLKLVRDALSEENGFIGVKLYPPMGFKPFGNEGVEQEYPEWVKAALGGQVGRRLDEALRDLFDTCTALSAPIMAHAGASNGAGPKYEIRADPAYWLPVFSRWPTLHVCLAHFGAFNARSALPQGETFPQASWEWTFGRFITEHPDAPVFADVSYFTEIFANPEARANYRDFMKAFLSEFDPECRKLIFGTDWIMVGLEQASGTYTGSIFEFFQTECGLDQPRLNRLFVENAVAFLGLRSNDGTRARLLSFYRRHGIPESRLPSFES